MSKILTCTLLYAAESITLDPIETISGRVRLPGSKSLSNRILLLAALSKDHTCIENILVRLRDPRASDLPCGREHQVLKLLPSAHVEQRRHAVHGGCALDARRRLRHELGRQGDRRSRLRRALQEGGRRAFPGQCWHGDAVCTSPFRISAVPV